MRVTDIFSRFPLELISVLLRCLLVQHGHLALFSFLKAFPRYSKLVLIGSPLFETLESLGISADTLKDLSSLGIRMLWFNTMFTSPLSDENVPSTSTLVTEEELIEALRSPRNLLRILLIPDCEYNTFEWSQLTFSGSVIARAIQHCDCVIVGTLEKQSHHRGIELIRARCELLKKPLTVCFERESPPQFMKGLIDRYFQYFHKRSPDKRVVKEYISGRDEQPCLVSEDVENVTLIGYNSNLLIEGRRIINYRFVMPVHCVTNEYHQLCLSPTVRQTPANLFGYCGSLYLEFSCCKIPHLASSSIAQTQLPFGKELVVENTHWSPENPFGRRVCNHAQEAGINTQADCWEPWDRHLDPYPLSSFTKVVLTGVPEGFTHFMNWNRTKVLHFRRLESMKPVLEPDRVIYFLILKELVIEGTSNDLCYGSFKVDAPLLLWLTITMLSESTRMWDLRSLLFHRPIEYTTELFSLTLEHNGDKTSIPLTLTDIQPVVEFLQILCVKGLHPLFLVDPQAHGSMTTSLPLLQYLLLDSSWSWPNRVSLSSSRFPCLKILHLGAPISPFSVSSTLHQIHLDPVPGSLEVIAIDRGFSGKYQVVVQGDRLTPGTTHGLDYIPKGNWHTWRRELNQSHFKYVGIRGTTPPKSYYAA